MVYYFNKKNNYAKTVNLNFGYFGEYLVQNVDLS
jgi:hypothetical protein